MKFVFFCVNFCRSGHKRKRDAPDPTFADLKWEEKTKYKAIKSNVMKIGIFLIFSVPSPRCKQASLALTCHQVFTPWTHNDSRRWLTRPHQRSKCPDVTSRCWYIQWYGMMGHCHLDVISTRLIFKLLLRHFFLPYLGFNNQRPDNDMTVWVRGGDLKVTAAHIGARNPPRVRAGGDSG